MTMLDTTSDAFRLLFSGDRELWGIVAVSLYVSLSALAIATPIAVAAGYGLAVARFPGRRALIVVLQAMLSFPTVVVGLVLYLVLSRRGLLGAWQLLFTPEAMILGQILIALPVLAAFTLAAVQAGDPRIHETAVSLGASPTRGAFTVLFETRFAIFAAVCQGFGRVISEVGCALMVGGNIAGSTRTITTAIALETSKGDFAQGIALGFVLLVLAFGVNIGFALVQGRGSAP